MCLFQGGRHIDYVVDQIVAKLIEVVKKKNKAGVSVKPFQVAAVCEALNSGDVVLADPRSCVLR